MNRTQANADPTRFAVLLITLGALSILATLLSGCKTAGGTDQYGRYLNSDYKPVNILDDNDAALPEEMVRVAVLPINGAGLDPEMRERLESTFRSELSKTMRFEIVAVDHAELEERYRQRQFLTTDRLPADFLAFVEQRTAADAVLFTEFTHFSPYRPIAIGVRSRLVDLASGESIWAADSLFDSADARISRAATRFHGRDGIEQSMQRPEVAVPALQSPNRFAEYAAASLYATLPIR